MHQLKERIFNSESFQNFQSPEHAGNEIQVAGLKGSLRSLFLAYLVEVHQKQLLFISSDSDSGERLRDDIELILGKEYVSFFPASEISPYDDREPNASLVRLRLESLRQIINQKQGVVIAPLKGVLTKVPSPEDFIDHQFSVARGDEFHFENLVQSLSRAGYIRSEVVEDVGQFAVRGGIIDVYPWSNDDPIRIEFFADTIESLRTFSIISQRSIEEIDQAEFLPNFEEEDDLKSIFSYMGRGSIIILENNDLLHEQGKQFNEDVLSSYQKHKDDNIFPKQPDKKYLKYEQLLKEVFDFPVIRFDMISIKNIRSYHFQSSLPPTFAGHLNRLFSYLKKCASTRSSIVIQCDTKAQAERFFEILEDEGLDYTSRISVGALHTGFIFPELDLQVLTDHEIFDRFKRRKTYKRFKNGEYLRSLNALNLYDYVVHTDYGIGQYMGLETLTSGDKRRECIKLHYAEGDTLFISVDRLNRVQKYSSEQDLKPKLTKLGTGEWEKLKKKTKESVSKIAAELIQINAGRKAHEGVSYSSDSHWQRELEATFPFEETEDQLRSIIEVKRDLEKNSPMDRLLCGDVGYGKTEVALRSAFKVVMDGKQVALLVPTTILAFQHFQTFKERMSTFPINLEMLSRFRTTKEQKQVISRLESGNIDVVIGTHRLLSQDIKFKDLGLLIVDEEQRFGVTHKERLKKIRMTVDILTMTATPIPRTLHMALMGARDLSNIETPPRNRLPVITEIHEWDDELIMRAIQKEMERGGQVYFVHNRIHTINGVKKILQEIVPTARIAIAHGQLPEKQLETIMLDYINRKYDVLVSTMIIENGLDIPNVNTIIIDRADKFGLAQLYQIRGRVGRSNEQAYAYLIVPHLSRLTNLAQKRLRAIQDFTDLGSGFKVALRDMEIRGIGNILGKEQSGNIQAVGFNLYCRILDDAVKKLKMQIEDTDSEKVIEHYTDPKIDVDFDLVIPKDYVFSEAERVTIYHRLVNLQLLDEVEKVKTELEDRFGPVPKEVINLIDTIEVKILAGKIFASRIILNNSDLKVHFDSEVKNKYGFFNQILPSLMNQILSKVQFIGDQDNPVVQFAIRGESDEERITFVKNLLKSLF
jgi:transcription-repair coupling factor (superfamily II helicase)